MKALARLGAAGLLVCALAVACNTATAPIASVVGSASPDSSPAPSNAPTATESSAPIASSAGTGGVESLRAEVVDRRPHDVSSYTEGLVLADGRLFESSERGATLREEDPQTGSVLRSVTMDSRYSAEGIAVVDDKIIQLTLAEHTALVYRLSDFQQIGTFSYDTDGWGLCDDGTRLVMSDGTSRLYVRDRATFALLGTQDVTNAGVPVDRLNELECVGGEVYANVWLTDTIVRVDPSSGHVDAVIDASGLLAPQERPGDEDAVLNGIAHDSVTDTFVLTGKLWPWMFEVHFVMP